MADWSVHVSAHGREPVVHQTRAEAEYAASVFGGTTRPATEEEVPSRYRRNRKGDTK